MSKKKKAPLIIAVQIVFLSFAIFMALFVMLVASRVDNYYANVFNRNYFTVNSDEMSNLFDSKDIVVTKTMKSDQIVTGQTIAYFSRNVNTYSEIIINEVKSIEEISGVIYFNAESPESNYLETVSEADVLGVYQSKMTNAASFLGFLNTFIGYIIFVGVPFIVLISFSLIRLKKYLSFDDETENSNSLEVIEAVSIKPETSHLKYIVKPEKTFESSNKPKEFINEKNIRIQCFKCREKLKSYLIIKKDESVKYWTCKSASNSCEVYPIEDNLLFMAALQAFKKIYEQKKVLFNQNISLVAYKLIGINQENMNLEEIMKEIYSGEYKKYYDLVMSFFEIIVISNLKIIFHVANSLAYTKNPQKDLQTKNRMKEEVYKEQNTKQQLTYTIVY